jgi:xylulokinase
VQRHEPEIFRQVDKVLLPKDYLRLRMTGEFASDMSDAAGTMWLDVAKRDWSDELLAACGLSRDNMPALFEGCEVTGTLRPLSPRRGICRRRWWSLAAAITLPVR